MPLILFFSFLAISFQAQSQISKECEKILSESDNTSDIKSCSIGKESLKGFNESFKKLKKQERQKLDEAFVKAEQMLESHKYRLKEEIDPEIIKKIKKDIKSLKEALEDKENSYKKFDEIFKILKAYPSLQDEDLQIFVDTFKLCSNQKFLNYGKAFFKQAFHSFTSFWSITDLAFMGNYEGLLQLTKRKNNNLLSENFTKKMSSPGFNYALNECFPGKVDGSLMNVRVYFFTAGLLAETLGNFTNIYILIRVIPKAIIYAINLARFGILRKTKFKSLKELNGIVSKKRIRTYQFLKYTTYAGLGLMFIPVFKELKQTYQIIEEFKKKNEKANQMMEEMFGIKNSEKDRQDWTKAIINLQKQTVKKAKRVLKIPLIEEEEREELLEKLSLLGEKGPDYVELFKKTRISYRSLVYKDIKSNDHFEDFYKNIEKKYKKAFKREIEEEASLEVIKKFRKAFYQKYTPYYQIRLDLENKKLQENLKNKHSSCLKEDCLFTKKDFHRLFNYITEEERDLAEKALKEALEMIEEES